MVGMLIFSVVTTSHAHLQCGNHIGGGHAHLQCGNHIGGVMVLIFSVVTTSVV